MISQEDLLEISAIADELVEVADVENDGMSAMACLMAAATFIVSSGTSSEMAVKALLSFMNVYSEELLEKSNGGH
jgi:hypothetical protein